MRSRATIIFAVLAIVVSGCGKSTLSQEQACSRSFDEVKDLASVFNEVANGSATGSDIAPVLAAKSKRLKAIAGDTRGSVAKTLAELSLVLARARLDLLATSTTSAEQADLDRLSADWNAECPNH